MEDTQDCYSDLKHISKLNVVYLTKGNSNQDKFNIGLFHLKNHSSSTHQSSFFEDKEDCEDVNILITRLDSDSEEINRVLRRSYFLFERTNLLSSKKLNMKGRILISNSNDEIRNTTKYQKSDLQ